MNKNLIKTEVFFKLYFFDNEYNVDRQKKLKIENCDLIIRKLSFSTTGCKLINLSRGFC